MPHDHHHDHHHDHASAGGHTHEGAPAGLPADAVAECPVMVGTTVVEQEAEEAGLVREHAGSRYWLCCNSCGEQWDADPAAFAVA
ncbi:hypothetical protein [Georgenia yuyongxinii]